VQLAERRARHAAHTPEEQAELAQRRTAAVAERKQRAEADRARREQSLASPFSVVLDCAFAHLMTAKESKSLVAQFNHAYAANVRAAVPCRLCFTGLAGELAAGYDRHAGSDRWKVVRSDRSYLDVFAAQRDSLVYLTADSPNELAE
jgi:tRNA (guanine9-N1)-methyltransferase